MPLSDSLLSIIDPSRVAPTDEELDEAEKKKKKEREAEVRRLALEAQRSLPSRIISNAVAGIKTAGKKGTATVKAAAAVAAANSSVVAAEFPDPEERQAFIDSLIEQSKEDSAEGDEIDRKAREIDEIAGGSNKRVGTAVRGTFSSLAQMGLMAPTGPVGLIGSFAATAATDGYHQAIDAGQSKDQAIEFAIRQGVIEGGITSAFQGLGKFVPGMGGVEGLIASKTALKKGMAAGARGIGIRTSAELTEEMTIGVAGAVNTALSGVDPEATSAENIMELIKDTAATTLLTMGLAEAGLKGGSKAVNVVADAEQRFRQGEAVDLTPEEEEGFRRDFTIDALAELDPNKATRKQVAEALGLEPANLPDEFKTREARQGAIFEAQRLQEERTASQDAALAEVQQDEDTTEAIGPDIEDTGVIEPEDAEIDAGRDTDQEGAETAQGTPESAETGQPAVEEPSKPEIVAPVDTQAPPDIQDVESATDAFAPVQDTVSGLKVRDTGKPFQRDDDFDLVDGVREVRIEDIDSSELESDLDSEDQVELTKKVQETSEIEAIDIGVDKDGKPFLIANIEALDAARRLGKETVPANVFIDRTFDRGLRTQEEIAEQEVAKKQEQTLRERDDLQSEFAAAVRDFRSDKISKEQLDDVQSRVSAMSDAAIQAEIGKAGREFDENENLGGIQRELANAQEDVQAAKKKFDSAIKRLRSGQRIKQETIASRQADLSDTIEKVDAIQERELERQDFIEAETGIPPDQQPSSEQEAVNLDDQAEIFGTSQDDVSGLVETSRSALDEAIDEQFEPLLPEDDADPELGGLNLDIFKGAKKGRKAPAVKDRAPSDPGVDAREKAAMIAPNEEHNAKVKKTREDYFNMIVRTSKDLPNDPKFAVAREVMRLYKDTSERAARVTDQRLNTILDTLKGDPDSYDLFRRYIVALDHHESINMGEPARWGWNPDDVAARLAELQTEVDTNEKVQKAYNQRKAILKEVQDELMEMGLIPDTAERGEYFRHQIRQYVLAQAHGGSKLDKETPDFARARVKGRSLPSQFDPNTDYFGPEREFLSRAHQAIQTRKAMNLLESEYNKMPELKKKAGSQAKALELARADESLTVWQPKEGSVWFPAMTITEAQIEKINETMMQADMGLNPDDFNTVMALGGKFEQWAIPNELAEQLNNMKRPEEDHAVAKLLQKTQSAWKKWILHNPLTVFTYNLRNMAGDLDIILAGDPAALLQVPKALVEVVKVHAKQVTPSKSYQEALEWSVIDAGEVHADIYKAAKDRSFKEFQPERQKSTGKFDRFVADPFERFFADPYDAVMKKVFVGPTSSRESVFRYAAFLDYKKKMASGKKFHHGASKPETVSEIRRSMGDTAAAAHMARNLVGDYGNVTVAGDYARKYLIPFWAFSELNIRRYKQVAVNNAKHTHSENKAINTALMAMAYSRMASMMGLAALSNHLFFADDEEKLSEFDKNNPHLIVPDIFNIVDDDNVLILRNISAFGEMIEWVGGNDLISELINNVDGTTPGAQKTTPSDAVLGMMNNFSNKLASSITPIFKGPVEVASGTSTFPDVFNPREVPRAELAAGQLGLRDAYLLARKMVAEDGTSVRPGMLIRPLMGVTNSHQNALIEAYNLMEKFEKSEGDQVTKRFPLSVHRKMKNAITNNDREAFNQTLDGFLEKRDFLGFTNIMNRMDPLFGKFDDEKMHKFLNDFITPEQMGRVQEARIYAANKKVRGITWFKDEMSKKSPEVQKQFEFNESKHVLRVFDAFTRPLRGKTEEAKAKIVGDQEEAMREMELLGLTIKEVKAALKTHNTASPRSKDRSIESIRRGIRRFKSL